MKIVVYNLGCKVNQYECDNIANTLRERGHEVSESLTVADIYIINTCAVTNEAERKSRQCVARCKKLNQECKVVVCGCASQNNAEQFASKEGVTYVSGVSSKHKIVDNICNSGVAISDLPTKFEEDCTPKIDRIRAFIKIQDGCNHFCSYCIIPYLRGRSRSRDEDSIVNECQSLTHRSKEIVLTGIDISSYGLDIGVNLAHLVGRLQEVECRIRLGSLEVNIIDDELLQNCKKLKDFCPQFHLSLQSGEDGVLKNMNRHYTTDEYYQKVQLIRQYYPTAGITTDLICGYPTESEESFAKTLEFVAKVNFSQMHIFGFSARKGTLAFKLKQLDPMIIKDRCERMASLANRQKEEYYKSFVGREMNVLMEMQRGENCEGYSEEYIKIRVHCKEKDNIVHCKGQYLEDDCLVATVVE